ncbi:hypothetical protein MA05_17085 [Comamonas aquatica]|nr:YbaK/EbsC family protein [Comamonas aquatica]ANY63478.1 hypothetical protein MA05_17085 [Comamonas aquatica]MDH0383428.1 DUF1289 domain-containing protein [Comamonas aquatica]MDH0431399.1 DUF1289 domain-containing protein [Comamonas aquatica]MDH0942501.1 DUF1289 domain-containing protein [Comamonas aquatica]
MCGSELHPLPEGVQRVARYLQDAGHPHAPQMLEGAARTAQEAADQLGIAVGQVAKSVIFKRKEDGASVLVVAAGDRRVDEKKVAALVGKIGRADADFVKDRTGFSIGGVSPVAHARPPVTLIDSTLQRFDVLWAAAGHPHAVFALSVAELRALAQAPVVDVAQIAGTDEAPRTATIPPVPEALRHKLQTVVALGSLQPSAAEAPPSPCISVCRMDADRQYCVGCLRTLDELRFWGKADATAKRQIWQQIQQRCGPAS